jgi:hypothetical protein
LDIAQAFDSLDHGHLLQLMLDTGFAPESVAVVRNLLRGGSTWIGTKLVQFLRGAPQGSPSSPFLSLLYFNSLARDIKDYVMRHAGDAPRLFGVQPKEKDAELFTLLLFADDTTLLGATPKFLIGLLKVVSAWGKKYGIRFKAAKSLLAQLSRPRTLAAESAYPAWAYTLKVQSQPIPVADGTSPVKLVGVPFHLAVHKQATFRAHPIDLSKARAALKALAGVFAPPRGRGGQARPAAVHFYTLRTGLLQTVIPAALYGAPVVPLQTEALDVEIRKALRQILGLPSNFPASLLHWALLLWPCELATDFAALKEAWKLRHQYWIGDYIAQASPAALERHATEAGPYRHLTQVLRKYGLEWSNVLTPCFQPEPATDTQPLPAGEKPAAYTKWVAHCRERIIQRFARWIMEKKEAYPATARWRAIFPPSLAAAVESLQVGHLPDALVAGDVGRAALRMWAPQLSQLPRGASGASTCKWCAKPAGETGYHILECPAQPPRTQRLITRALEAIRRDMRKAGRPVDPRTHLDLERLYRTTWPGQELASLRECLLCVARAIDEYSTRAQRQAAAMLSGYDLVHPVRAVLVDL